MLNPRLNALVSGCFFGVGGGGESVSEMSNIESIFDWIFDFSVLGDILSLSSDFRLSLTGTCPSPMVLCGSGDLALTGIAGVAGVRVKHFAIFEKLVFALTSRTLRILMEHIDSICSLES